MIVLCLSSQRFRSDFVQILALGQILNISHRAKETPAGGTLVVGTREGELEQSY